MIASPDPTQVDLGVDLGPLHLEHPVVNASGTFDLLEHARRYEGDYFAYAAYVPKTITADVRTGNAAPRVTETAAGMINAIGLENPGVVAWIATLPAWAHLRQPVIVSVGGNESGQYAAVVRAVEEHLAAADPGAVPSIEAYEINVSCPNVVSGLQIGTDPAATAAVGGGAGGGASRRRRCLIGQHFQGDGARPGDPAPISRQSYRWTLRSGHQADRPAHGR